MPHASNPHERMRAAAARLVELSESQWHEFSSRFDVRAFARHATVLLPGSVDHQFFFIAEGLLRVYTLGDDGREASKGFIGANAFGGPLAAFMLGMPSLYGVEALEDTTILAARYGDLFALYDRHPVFDRFGRKCMEALVVHKELRERIALHETARERYAAFVKHFPDLADRVPGYHVASYLGMTPESLSRIRTALARRGA